MRNRIYDAIARLVVGVAWLPLSMRDRRMRRWVDITHEPMKDER